jgi:beta-glucosidase
MRQRTTCLIGAFLLGGALPLTAQEVPRLGSSSVPEVIGAMTVEEKARLLVGMGMAMFIPGVEVDPEAARIPEKVPGAAGRTWAIPRLGIPSLTLADGPAGVRIDPVRPGDGSRTYHATAFPVATLLAASWDTALVRRVGGAFGREALEYGVDILLAPGLNLHRNPLGGRNFEYYSEDPLLTGHLAAAFVDGVEAVGVGTSIKHFAANNQEFNRMQLNTHVSERALRELYLKNFRIAVERSQPWTVMSAYNMINGTSASQSAELLTTILRDEWGFQGFVMTDWFGGRDPVAQMVAGNEVLMPGYPGQAHAIVAAVAAGTLSEAQLDRNVERVLGIVLRTPAFRGYPYSERPPLAEHAQLAREAAAEGMVLLKNERAALPLAPGRRIALFGNASYDLIVGGTGSGDVNEAYSIAPAEGLVAAGYAIDSALREAYAQHIAAETAKRPPQPLPFFLPPPIPELPVGAGDVRRLSREADVAVITLGRNSGEFADRSVEADLDLTELEQDLIRSVSAAFRAAGKQVVVVMNVAGVTEVASWRDHADAILLAWQPGQEGGHAIADVLSGRVNPSGKLPMTFPEAYSDVPSAGGFPGRVLPGHEGPAMALMGVPSEVTYDEGIYVGYRYYNTFGVRPAYEFGYGLSYTTFAYGGLRLSQQRFDERLTASVTVSNTGPVPGREVVQLYLRAPGRAMDKPESELRGFAKTELLQPGQSQTLTFTLDAADLASFDAARSAWVAEPGRYTVRIGRSSLEAGSQATFQLRRERVVERTNAVLKPQLGITERTAPRRR